MLGESHNQSAQQELVGLTEKKETGMTPTEFKQDRSSERKSLDQV